MKLPILCYSRCKKLVDKLCLNTMLCNFKVQKSGEILCVCVLFNLMCPIFSCWVTNINHSIAHRQDLIPTLASTNTYISDNTCHCRD